MRKSTKNASLHEALRNLWKIRIMLEKNYTETCATWMARRIESLIDHMQYGHALIAYHKQDGTFRLWNCKHGKLSSWRTSSNGAPYANH